MSKGKGIGVGIVGVGHWAEYGHIPALNSLGQFSIIAVSSRSPEKAREISRAFAVPYAFSSEEQLVACPDVDLVVVLPPAPFHASIVKLAIAAGKDVYCEWPLTTSTSDSIELATLADAARVRHAVGLQRTVSPSARYLRHLIESDSIGDLRSVRMHVSMDHFGAIRSSALEWTVPAQNFSHILAIYGGHFMHMLFSAVGFPVRLSARTSVQFSTLRIGDRIHNNETADEIVVQGELANGALFQIQIEGGKTFPAGLQIDCTGKNGDLRVTNPKAFGTIQQDLIEGSIDGRSWEQIVLPREYQFDHESSLDFSVKDLARLYELMTTPDGSEAVPNFYDAVRVHQVIDAIEKSALLRAEMTVG